MNKKQLIARVQRYMGPGATRSTASAAVEAVLASILNGADNEKGVRITRFGTFRKKAAQDGTRKLRFSPSRHLPIPQDKQQPT
ncbi:MAG: HU family DNA-binding protein [Akkermansia sp.]|nr:HU family DNA-binding protein [Akkermansia sp.]